MRFVLDTNVLARVVMSPQGPAAELFERIASDHLLITSLALLAELSRVLAYDRVRRIHRLSDQAIGEFVRRIEAGSLVALPADPIPKVVAADPDDDVVVATAVAGQADYLCTRNRHLFSTDVLAYCSQHGLQLMDDLQLLELLRNRSPDPSP